MTTNSTQPGSRQTPEAVPQPLAARDRRWLGLPIYEAVLVAAILAVTAALRFTLAAQGWPHTNSDEATIGLMTDDILWHGAHPAFTYGEHHVGSFGAYLAAPFFLALGPTNFALHLTTNFQTVLFLPVFYAFTRIVYSPLVACGTLLLLALGPAQAVFYEMRAGAHAQDTLLFGALLLWLVVLRLRPPKSSRAKIWLNAGIGLVVGLGLWSTFLLLPFIVAAGVALGTTLYHQRGREPGNALATEVAATWPSPPSPRMGVPPYPPAGHAPNQPQPLRYVSGRTPTHSRQFLVMAAGLVIGMAPFIVSTIASHGVIFGEILRISGGAGSGASGGLLAALARVGLQVLTTLLVGLPSMLGSWTVCAHCPVWPTPDSAVPPSEALRAVLTEAPFALLFITCWLLAAWRLKSRLRAFRQQVRLRGLPNPSSQAPDEPQPFDQGEQYRADTPFDARWWGQAMLVIGGGLTVLEYMASSASYQFAGPATRYLIGVYLCTPLLADPLWQSTQQVWQWLKGSSTYRRPESERRAGSAAPDTVGDCQGRSPEQAFRTAALPGGRGGPEGPRVPARWPVLQLAAVGCLILLLTVNILGTASTLSEASNHYGYGVPAGERDAQLLAFLEMHNGSYFYTSWWVCYQLMFEAKEQATCSIVSNSDAFAPGNFNRVPAYADAVLRAAHPAYVFDTTTTEVQPRVPGQIADRIAAGDPRFLGYTSAAINGYLVYYYAGAPAG